MTNELKTLFQSYQLGNKLTLKNRIIMAPMTRNLANNNFTPSAAMADYYQRRSDAGLIITEGTTIRPDARGYSNTPAIFTDQQIEAWKNITSKVHEKDGHIFLQIWHAGRVSHPHFLNGKLPISASSTIMNGRVPRTKNLYYGKSIAATSDEIKGLVESFSIAAKNAITAGFDGIEVHGANGYLIDQFLHYDTNQRNDEYGGSPENMARFPLETIEAIGATIGFEKVGLRISPAAYINGIRGNRLDSGVFKYLLSKLNSHDLAYIHTGNFDDSIKFDELNNMTMTAFIREHYKKTLVACGSYQFEQAEQDITNQKYDLLGIGRPFIANPDLIMRLRTQTPLNVYDKSMLDVLY